MTNLELIICEAENAGEIDLDTRNLLLDILCESSIKSDSIREPKRISIDEYNKFMAQHEKDTVDSRSKSTAQSVDAEVLDDGDTDIYNKRIKAMKAIELKEKIDKQKLMTKRKKRNLNERIDKIISDYNKCFK